ncbi:MAG: hypothetical protein ABWK01_02975 [Infirmifilum sp.]
MLLPDLSAALAALFYLALGGMKWFLGRRSEAISNFEAVVDVLAHLLILQLVFSIADTVATAAGIRVSLGSPEFVSERLNASASVFWEASQTAVSTILYVQTERAVLAAAPLTSPLSSVLGAATGWSTTELSIVAIFFMHLSFATRVFSTIAPFLVSIGSVLLPVPKIRRLGASLLAIYLSTSIAVIYGGSVTEKTVEKIKVPSPINPLDWVNIAGLTSDIAISLGQCATIVAVALALSIAAGYGMTSVFDSIYVTMVRA